MEENNILGGAGPALAAHSKDASAPGPTSASRTLAPKKANYPTGAGRFIYEQPFLGVAVAGAVGLAFRLLLRPRRG